MNEVGICNGALLKVGAKTITSLTDPGTEAKVCNEFYPRVRDAVLRAHPWNCAIERRVLSEISPVPAFGYDHQYQLPTDPFCLRVLTLNEPFHPRLINGLFFPLHSDFHIKFKIEGRKLLTDETEAKIVYIARVSDPTQWDALLVEAVEARLAHEIAFAITKSMKVIPPLWELYKDKLQEARTIDGQEGTVEAQENSDIEMVRY